MKWVLVSLRNTHVRWAELKADEHQERRFSVSPYSGHCSSNLQQQESLRVTKLSSRVRHLLSAIGRTSLVSHSCHLPCHAHKCHEYQLRPAVKWLGIGAINPLVVDGKGGKAELIPAVRRWVKSTGRSVTLPGELGYPRWPFSELTPSHDRVI
jgi:hypothetical protein